MANTTIIPYKRRGAPPADYRAGGPLFFTTELDRISQAIFRSSIANLGPYAIRTGEVGVTDSSWPVGWLPRYGAALDGVTDDTTAWQNAVDSSKGAAFPEVIQPWGSSVITATITISTGCTLKGFGGIPGGLSAGASSFPTVLHDFNGDLFVFDAADGLTQGSGGGVERLRLVQVFGDASMTGGVGSAIKYTALDGSHRASWTKTRLCNIEESGAAPWTWGIECDGGSFHVVDLYIGEVSMHTTGTWPGAGGMRFNGVAAAKVYHCTCYDTGGSIAVGDTDLTAQVLFVDVDCAGTLAFDNAGNCSVVGGIFTSITNTANTIGTNRVDPVYLVTPFVDNSSGAMGVMNWTAGTKDFTNSGGMRLNGAGLYGGTGAPGVGLGTDGDYYFRHDTPATVTQRIYVKDSGTWTGIL